LTFLALDCLKPLLVSLGLSQAPSCVASADNNSTTILNGVECRTDTNNVFIWTEQVAGGSVARVNRNFSFTITKQGSDVNKSVKGVVVRESEIQKKSLRFKKLDVLLSP